MDYRTRIRAVREDRDYSQAQIRKILNKSQQGYNHIETGRAELKIDGLILLCKFRTCIHNRWTPSGRVFFRHTASISLEIRQPRSRGTSLGRLDGMMSSQDSCGKFPCLAKKSLAHPASPVMNTGSYNLSADYMIGLTDIPVPHKKPRYRNQG